jgi:hypothetical protein
MKWAPCLAGLCALVSGCNLVSSAAHNLTLESRQYLDTRAEEVRNRRWAEQAWEEERASAAPGTYSADYADGFRTGFADYLFAGGSGEPPYLPPPRYWTRRYQSPEGHGALQDWFTGFRHGAATAREGGYREWVTLAGASHPFRASPDGADAVLELPPLPVPLPPPEQAREPWVKAELLWPVHWSLSVDPDAPPGDGAPRRRSPEAPLSEATSSPGTGVMP